MKTAGQNRRDSEKPEYNISFAFFLPLHSEQIQPGMQMLGQVMSRPNFSFMHQGKKESIASWSLQSEEALQAWTSHSHLLLLVVRKQKPGSHNIFHCKHHPPKYGKYSLHTSHWISGTENIYSVIALLSHNSLCKGVKPSAFIPWRAIESIVMTKIPHLGCNKRGGKTKEERLIKMDTLPGLLQLSISPGNSCLLKLKQSGTQHVPHCPHDTIWWSLNTLFPHQSQE